MLPPVVLPVAPPSSHDNKKKEILLNVEDKFKENVIKVDASSIESLEFLSDDSLLAVGCGSGVTKVVSLAQGNSQNHSGNVQFVLKGEDKSPVTGLACNQNSSQLRHALMVTHSEGTL